MIVALIDNGSLEPAAHRNLRAVAAALSMEAGIQVRAVSWKHSDRIPEEKLGGTPAWAVAPFLRSLYALGQRQFVFVPFFVSAQGAIGSALRKDLEAVQAELEGLEFTFTEGLADRGVLAPIVSDRIRATLRTIKVSSPAPVIVVDHGGPSPQSRRLRDHLAAEVRAELGPEIGRLAAASMEGDAPHNRPHFADLLRTPGFNAGQVIVAPLFLSLGRHAGADGDLARIARDASHHSPGLRCHFTELIGSHPLVVPALATALRTTLSTLHAQPFA